MNPITLAATMLGIEILNYGLINLTAVRFSEMTLVF